MTAFERTFAGCQPCCEWGELGPGVVQQVLISEPTPACLGVQFLPPSAYSAVSWERVVGELSKLNGSEVVTKLERYRLGGGAGLHLYNHVWPQGGNESAIGTLRRAGLCPPPTNAAASLAFSRPSSHAGRYARTHAEGGKPVEGDGGISSISNASSPSALEDADARSPPTTKAHPQPQPQPHPQAQPQAQSPCETSAAALSRQHEHGSYNLLAVAIFKQERRLLREWVHHHVSEGIDHFLLIDNNNSSRYEEGYEEACELRTFITAGVVTLVRDPTRHAQPAVMARHLHPFVRTPARTQWVLNVDLDEFAYARGGRHFPSTTIWQFLRNQPTAASALYLPWKIFGVAGSVQPAGEITLHAVRRWPSGIDTGEKKWIARAEVLTQPFTQHAVTSIAGQCMVILPDLTCFVDGPGVIQDGSLPNYSLHLNHYTLQASREAFAATKMVRGDVLEAAWDRSWGWKKFSLFDGKATVLDDELQRKRLASMHTDQAMLDSLLCGRQHVGGTLPRQWCKR